MTRLLLKRQFPSLTQGLKVCGWGVLSGIETTTSWSVFEVHIPEEVEPGCWAWERSSRIWKPMPLGRAEVREAILHEEVPSR